MIALRRYAGPDKIDELLGYIIEDLTLLGIKLFSELDHYVDDVVEISGYINSRMLDR